MQLISDLLGMPIERTAHCDMTCLGAAFMAGLAKGEPALHATQDRSPTEFTGSRPALTRPNLYPSSWHRQGGSFLLAPPPPNISCPPLKKNNQDYFNHTY